MSPRRPHGPARRNRRHDKPDPRHNASLLSLGLALALAFQPTRVPAQTGVHSIDFHADLATDDGSAIVEIEIEFVPDDTAGLRIELLGFARGWTDGFRTPGPDGALIRFDGRSGSREWVLIERDEFAGLGIERTDSIWRLRAGYVIHDAAMTDSERVRVHVPVLTVALPPVTDAGDVFHADVRVPSYWAVTEGFPTGFRPASEDYLAVDLAVAPSVISLRARTDGTWRPGVPLLLDILAGIILAGFLFIGWRHLRESASEGRG